MTDQHLETNDTPPTGGWIPIDVNSLHSIELAKFAVDEHNKQAYTQLKFNRLVSGESQIVVGVNYKLIIKAINGELIQTYEAHMFEALNGQRVLNSFKIITSDIPQPGGWQPVEDVKEVEGIGRFAVAEHNKEARTHLKFEGVLKGETQIVEGINYRLTIRAINGELIHNYEARVCLLIPERLRIGWPLLHPPPPAAPMTCFRLDSTGAEAAEVVEVVEEEVEVEVEVGVLRPRLPPGGLRRWRRGRLTTDSRRRWGWWGSAETSSWWLRRPHSTTKSSQPAPHHHHHHHQIHHHAPDPIPNASAATALGVGVIPLLTGIGAGDAEHSIGNRSVGGGGSNRIQFWQNPQTHHHQNSNYLKNKSMVFDQQTSSLLNATVGVGGGGGGGGVVVGDSNTGSASTGGGGGKYCYLSRLWEPGEEGL
ncbi:hypothetical protein Scep_013902 [Stephania cephalantha]|uniref:Cystatin domain-containing protein n=1 Tax=Stephania cephalantha TaxID=152367 RepID=A0AAP0J2S8_9MAGN